MKYFLFLFLIFMGATVASSQCAHTSRADAHAPLGVMGDHSHNKGEWMISYRYMNMQMDGMRSGTDNLTLSDVHETYMVSPTDMAMDMHMIGLMFAPGDRVTLMAMTSIISSDMSHVMRNGNDFTTHSDGIGDLQIGGIYSLVHDHKQNFVASMSLGIPVGSIENKGVTPMSEPNEVLLPYPMQSGSGTFDLIPAITYSRYGKQFSGGIQLKTVVRLNENDHDYALGNQYRTSAWLAFRADNWISISNRLSYSHTGELDGADPAFAMQVAGKMVPTVIGSNYGGDEVRNSFGVNFLIPSGTFEGLRLGIEYDIPVLLDLNGIQLETDNFLTIGLQYIL